MIVNESFARRFFDGRDPVGRRVQIYGKPFQIVGMAKDSKYYNLSEAPQPYFYMSFDQATDARRAQLFFSFCSFNSI